MPADSVTQSTPASQGDLRPYPRHWRSPYPGIFRRVGSPGAQVELKWLPDDWDDSIGDSETEADCIRAALDGYLIPCTAAEADHPARYAAPSSDAPFPFLNATARHLAEGLAGLLSDPQSGFDDEQRMQLLGLVHAKFCDQCGSLHLPCYCDSSYDD